MRGYRFWFYEADLVEPPHVHVGKAGREAKFWVDPVSLARAGGFRRHELAEIERIIAECKSGILAAWEKEQDKRGYHQS
ncbi:MAG: DUF4160 domain-containing protein [Candidatus Sumerlaeota bacterium]|nr:DUF4160 domain-containing protein [Candidatus Sumerlaeota bacterium]